MLTIGITGTLGSGKGTVVEFLKGKGFRHFKMSDFIIEEIKKRGLPINRDTMVQIGNELREKHGSGFIADELYKRALANGTNAIIESLRAIGEVETLKAKGSFYLFAVDADPKIRYERIKERRSEKDNISFKKFLEDEKREMNSPDPNKQNIAACMKLADYTFLNNGSKEDLRAQAEKALAEIHSALN